MSALDTTTAGRRLDRQQIKAFRNAETALFRFERHKDGRITGELELRKNVAREDGFGLDTLRVDVPIGARLIDYSYDCSLERLGHPRSGDWIVTSAQVHEEWRTFVSALRPGDRLTAVWVADNRSPAMARAGWTNHEFKAQVDRPRRDGWERYTYLLDTRCEPAGGFGVFTRDEAV